MTTNRKFSVIAAACKNMGIGINGSLPWRLRNELAYFNRITSTTTDKSRQNCVIMGRKTYFGIPEKFRPLPNRLNIILSSTSAENDFPAGVILCKSLPEALLKLSHTNLGDGIENVWIVGGHNVYKEAMASNDCYRVYLTEILAEYECDTFFPTIDSSFKLVSSPEDIPSETQEENGIQYKYKIYEKQQ